MPRRKTTSFQREIGADVRFHSVLVQRLINTVLRCGKKNLARSIVYEALDILIKKAQGGEQQGIALFEKAVASLKPAVELKSRRVGGGVYQVPIEARPTRALALAFKWLIQAAKARENKTMGQRLAAELLDAAEGRGNALKKKIEIHRMAEANRAFSHYAW